MTEEQASQVLVYLESLSLQVDAATGVLLGVAVLVASFVAYRIGLSVWGGS